MNQPVVTTAGDDAHSGSPISLPNLPGGTNGQLGSLRHLLRSIGDGAPLDAPFKWPDANGYSTLREALKLLGPVGLTHRNEAGVRLSEDGARWLQNNDPGELIKIFSSRTRFIGPVLKFIAAQADPVTVQEVADMLKEEFGADWETLAPIRNIEKWLRATGMVSFFKNGIHITELGERVASEIKIPSRTTHAEGRSFEISPAVLLAIQKRANREDCRSMYLPTSARGRIHAIRTLLDRSQDGISVNRFHTRYNEIREKVVRRNSAIGILESLERIGFLKRVEVDKWIVSQAASIWIQTGNPFDAAAIVHSGIKFFGEILLELSKVEVLTTHQAHLQSAKYMSGEKLHQANAVRPRLQILQELGFVRNVTSTKYSITPSGLGLLAALPIAEAAEATPSEKEALAPELEQISAQGALTAPSHPDLFQASLDGHKPKRLEVALVDSFNFLGIPAEKLGQDGTVEPDGVAKLGVGKDILTVALEAKASNSGMTMPMQVDIPAIGKQRRSIGAALTIMVGPDFHPNVIDVALGDGNIALVSAGVLESMMKAHGTFPVMGDEIQVLLDASLHPSDRGTKLREIWGLQQHRREHMRSALEVLHEFHERKSKSWMSRSILEYAVETKIAFDKDLLEEAMSILSHPMIDAMQKRVVEVTGSEEYRLTAAPDQIYRRLTSLGLIGTSHH
jgi:hypothetical protein